MKQITPEKLEEFKNCLESNNIKLVLFAETHGILDETKIQKQVLSEFNPDIFIYELLENKSLKNKEEINRFLEKKDDADFSIISKYTDLKKTILLARDFNLPIVGCDLKNMGRKDTSFRTREFSDQEQLEEEELMKTREKEQLRVIKNYLSEGRIIFASLGIYHLLHRSELIKGLSSLDYLVIYPILENGEMFGYSENFNEAEISYVIKTKKSYLNNETKN